MNQTLSKLREQIDVLDNQLLNTLAQRIEVVKKIGDLKKDLGLPPLDEKRWHAVLSSKISKGKLLDLSEDFIKKIYKVIHEYSLEVEAKK